MKGFINWLQRFIFPWAARIGRVRWLAALRDAFVILLPVNLIGSLAVLFTSLVHVLKTQLGWHLLAKGLFPIVACSDLIWQGTFKLFSLYFALAWGYQLASRFGVNRLMGASVSLGSFLMSVANVSHIRVNGEKIRLANFLNLHELSMTGLFTAILFGGLGVAFLIWAQKNRLGLRVGGHMPAVEKVALEYFIPVLLSLASVALVNFLFQGITGTYFSAWLLEAIQQPLIRLGQGFGPVMLVTFVAQVLWFFGLNGTSILAPVIDSIWLTPEIANLNSAKNGQVVHYLWGRSSFDIFAGFGGAGGTLVLVIAILCISKRADFRSLAKIALAPSIFNINWPVVYGLPIVLNPAYVVPFIVAPLVNTATAYWVTALGWVHPVQATMPSVMPPLLNSFLACNYDWHALVLTVFNMVVAFLIWLPFVKAAERIAEFVPAENHFQGPNF